MLKHLNYDSFQNRTFFILKFCHLNIHIIFVRSDIERRKVVIVSRGDVRVK